MENFVAEESSPQASIPGPSAALEPEALKARRKLGSYVLLEALARGGMAEIFLARQTGPEGFSRRAVVKKLLPQYSKDPRFVQMFFEEARLAGLINHPNVVSIFEMGEGAGPDGLFIAMEYIDGCNLRNLARHVASRGRILPLNIVARIIADACAGLDFAHNLMAADGKPLGLIHRDISPENILITYTGIAKIVDFGIAKASTSKSMTQVGELKGKLSFLAPEQLLGQPVDRRVDVWALGVTLYWLITGVKPFAGRNEGEVLTRILHSPPPPVRELAPHVDKDLERILMRAMEKDPRSRTPSAAELQAELEAWSAKRQQVTTPSQIAAYLVEQFSESADLRRISYSGPMLMAEGVSPAIADDVAQSMAEDNTESVADSDFQAVEDSPAVSNEPSRPFPSAVRTRWQRAAVAAGTAVFLLGVVTALFFRNTRVALASRAAQTSRKMAALPSPSVATTVAPLAAILPPAPQPAPEATVAAAPAAAAEPPKAAASPEPMDRPHPTAVVSAPKPRAPKASASAEPGWLNIQVLPWAQVSVDGVEKGETPLKPFALPPGRHSIALVNPDLGVQRVATVLVRSGEIASIQQTLSSP